MARRGNVIPIARTILADMETPVSAYRKIARGRYSFLLESVEGGSASGAIRSSAATPRSYCASTKAKLTCAGSMP